MTKFQPTRTREQARQEMLARIDAERKAIMIEFDATVAEIKANKPAPVVNPVPRTFEVDGKQIPYEAEKCNDARVSNDWKAIVDANR